MAAHRIAGSRFGYTVNCDSGLFVRAALHPRQVVATDHPYQSRPLYFALPAAVGAVAGENLVFKTYQALNIATLAFAVWLLGRLVDGPRRWWLLVVPLFLLNDIVKAFLWTPHSQILNIATPLIGMWLLLALSSERRLPWYLVSGLAAGFGILVYGTVIPVVAAVLLLVAWERRSHGVRHGAAFAAMASLPPLAWVAAVIAVRGRFYSHETTMYRQVVWLADADPAELASNTMAWMASVWGAVALSVLIAVLGLFLAWRQGWRPPADLVGPATVLTVALAGFTWSLGFYPQRLTWAVVVPLLVVTARALSSVALPRWQAVAYGGAVAAWSVGQVLSAGPWA